MINGTLEGDRLLGPDGMEYPQDSVAWLPPVIPSKIVALALNYSEHAGELGLESQETPVLFIKPNSSLLGHLGKIIYPRGTKYMHYEAELAVVMGRSARKIRASKASDYVMGYTIANDVTLRDFITNTYRPPVKAKGFDTCCPLGPCVVTSDEIHDESNLEIKTLVNGRQKQEGNTKSMIHGVSSLVEYISEFMTLEPYDLILTGTPKGISPIVPGDRVDITIDHLGTLSNTVVQETERLSE